MTETVPVGSLRRGDSFRYPSGTFSLLVNSVNPDDEKVTVVSSGGAMYLVPYHRKVIPNQTEEI